MKIKTKRQLLRALLMKYLNDVEDWDSSWPERFETLEQRPNFEKMLLDGIEELYK